MQNKIDLHIHFDGSLPEETVIRLAYEHFDVLTNEEKRLLLNGTLFDSLSVSDTCNSLNEYLKKFDLPCRLLQTPEAVELAMYHLVSKLDEQGLRYVEIRFSPQLHSVIIPKEQKLEWETLIVEAAIRGMDYATEKCNISANLILCCMRNLPEGDDGIAANIRNIYIAAQYLNEGVCGVDLAGAEARDATSNFKDIFLAANALGIPFTIHAGESGSPEWRINSIKTAIDFGARRIGHGVGLMYSEELQDLVIEKDIAVCCCLKSNIDTMAVDSIWNHPIKHLFTKGVKVTLNTDNMTVSRTNLGNEYKLAKLLGFTEHEIAIMQGYAFDAAFMNDDQRKKFQA